ncbi:MAG: M28 family peptidase [Bacteroidia bacterium]
MSNLLGYIQELEGKYNFERRDIIIRWLREKKIPIKLHKYATGTNIIIPATKAPKFGVSGHFDVVPRSPGANDNGSSIAVIMGLLEALQESPTQNIGVELMIFDEEETGLIGSTAYTQEFGVEDFIGLINLELVGMGNQFALWPLSIHDYNPIASGFERFCKQSEISTLRMDRIVMNTADHESFRDAGFEDAFTLTVISDQDKEVAAHYYKALEFNVDQKTLYEIASQAPVFQHYHQPTDLSVHLSEESLQMTVEAILGVIRGLDGRGF